MKVPFSFLFLTFQSRAAKINRIADGGKVNVHSTVWVYPPPRFRLTGKFFSSQLCIGRKEERISERKPDGRSWNPKDSFRSLIVLSVFID